MTYEPVMAPRRNNRGLRIALIVVGVVVRGSATVRLTTETGSTSTQVFSLVKEDGAWRICG